MIATRAILYSYSDDTLQSAERCFEKSCGSMSSCLDAELGN